MYMHIIVFVFALLFSITNLVPKEKLVSKKTKAEIAEKVMSERVKLTQLGIDSEVYDVIKQRIASQDTKSKPSRKSQSSVYEADTESAVFTPDASPAEKAAVMMDIVESPTMIAETKEPWEIEFDKLERDNVIQFRDKVASMHPSEEELEMVASHDTDEEE